MAEDPGAWAETDELPDAREAFVNRVPEQRSTPRFAVSRAAALLSAIRPHRRSLDERLVEEESRELLGVTPLEPFSLERGEAAAMAGDLGAVGARAAELLRMRTDEPRREELEAFAAEIGRESADSRAVDRDAIDTAQAEAANELFPAEAQRRPYSRSRVAAARLAVASLLDEHPLVRVAAAVATLRFDDRNPLAEAILEVGSRDQAAELAELARAGLANTRDYTSRRVEIEAQGSGEPQADSALIHGTWARRGRWWRPSGDLHRFLRDERVFPALYSGRDNFAWSGYFSFRTWGGSTTDWDRQQAGGYLAWWAERRLIKPPDLIGHSYGGSISMLATQVEKPLRGVVLLSPAVHRTCLPNPDYYEQVLLIRMRLDLVLLLDRSAPQLLTRMPNVTEWVLPRRGLNGHSATHDPAIWRANSLAERVRDEWLPVLTKRT